LREKRPPVVSLLVLPVLGHLCFSYFSLSFIPMSLRRPFVPPCSTRNKSVGNKTKKDKEVDSTKSPTTTGVGNKEEGCDQTPLSEWRVSDDEEGYDHTLTLTFLFQLFSSHLPPPAQTLLHKQARGPDPSSQKFLRPVRSCCLVLLSCLRSCCLVLYCIVLSYLVLLCLVSSCLVLSCLVFLPYP
jgi:hypothetical protein